MIDDVLWFPFHNAETPGAQVTIIVVKYVDSTVVVRDRVGHFDS